MSYLPEFLTIAAMHALAVVSPGPDFAIVIRQSLRHGRATAVWTSIGIGCGLSIHLALSLLGLGLVVRNSAWALPVVRGLGAAYLAWIGIQALRAKRRTGDVKPGPDPGLTASGAAWRIGFLVNVLNPKAALFILSLFALAVSPATPKWVQVGYGLWMSITTATWFVVVAIVFTRSEVRRMFLQYGHWIDRVLGMVFLGFAASLVVGAFN